MSWAVRPGPTIGRMSSRPRTVSRPLAALATLLLAVALTSCSGDSSDSAVDAGSGEAPAGSTTTCDYPADDMGAAKEVDPPSAEAPDTGEVTATITTNTGDIDIVLDQAATPCTVHSFMSLAEQGYFDDTQCHRLTTGGIFVLQCGDPSATGGGGPGYSFADELTGEETYSAGTLAMANAGPDTNGSQFFIVYDESPLDPNYNVFGSVGADGLQVVQDIAAKGAQGGAPDGPPAEPVAIESVTVG
jgi:peptidyl-prolyl cis-trans isomerase B (cyclophilin B)